MASADRAACSANAAETSAGRAKLSVMSRADDLALRLIERLDVPADDLTVQHVPARAAPVAQVDGGRLRGRRFTDVGPHGFGLYEIVDDGRGSFVNLLVGDPAATKFASGMLASS